MRPSTEQDPNAKWQIPEISQGDFSAQSRGQRISEPAALCARFLTISGRSVDPETSPLWHSRPLHGPSLSRKCGVSLPHRFAKIHGLYTKV